MTPSSMELEQISKAQTRQQVLLIILSIVLAASTIATWQSARAMRDANEIQRQLLAQTADTPSKSPQKRHASARPGTKASTQSRRSPSLRHAVEEAGNWQAMTDDTARADLTNTRALLVRPGRQ
jgi:hypothetical protein